MNDTSITESAVKIADQYLQDLTHSRQVARLAVDLFDASKQLHHLGDRERTLLETAALLHDIGWCEGQVRHHKRAFDLILQNPPDGLTPRELLITANTARYHRRALPKTSHTGFARLAPADRETVKRLAALLRVADGLDVTHRSAIRVLGCRLEGDDRAVIDIESRGDCSMEIEAASKKSDLFKETYRRKVSFTVTGSKADTAN